MSTSPSAFIRVKWPCGRKRGPSNGKTQRSHSSFREQSFPSLPRIIASFLVSLAGIRRFARAHEAMPRTKEVHDVLVVAW